LIVAIEDDGMHQANLLQAGVEIQAHGERKPLARAGISLVNTLDFDHRADRAGLFQGDFADAAGKAGAVFERADQSPLAGYHAALHRH